jgi:plasmid stabilization system protein ParE
VPRIVRLTDEASDDLAAIRRWQTQPGSGAPAKRRVKAILAVLRRLKTMPCLYPPGDEPGTRQAFCEGHVVIYEVDPDTLDNASAGDVLVLRVFAPGQDRR